MSKQKASMKKISALIYLHNSGYAFCKDKNCSICNEIAAERKLIIEREDYIEKRERTLFMAKEKYLELKNQGKNDLDIAAELGVTAKKVTDWKESNGLLQKRRV